MVCIQHKEAHSKQYYIVLFFNRQRIIGFLYQPKFIIQGAQQMKKRISSLLLIMMLLASVITNSMLVSADSTPQIKNVIVMIPDGGGFALFDFANAVKEAGGFNEGLYPNATKITANYMHLKNYLIGTETTHSANNAVTDSAASGTALSSGYKTNNGFVGIDPNYKPHATILEAAQLVGKRTGTVATTHWSHATPAAFTAHNENRDNYSILSEQVVNQGLDVVLGTGFDYAQWGSIKEASDRGYTITRSLKNLADVESGAKIWGNHNTSALDISLSADQPTLAQMTDAAIRALDGSNEGFFLMVEGSRVDTAGHNNNILQAVSEYIAFDEAFKVAVNYAQNRTDTVVIAVPDHDTGGLILPNADSVGGNINSSDYAAAVAEVQAGKNSTDGISWTSTGHSDRRCGIWMYAPDGINPPEGLSSTPGDTPANRNLYIDNTQIPLYLADLMGLDLEAATNELFVDITDLGTYDTSSSTFTFNDLDKIIKANQSVATVDGRKVDLEGKIAVYSKGRFYAPKRMLLRDNKIEVKTARYKDELTGRVLVKGQIDKAFAGKPLSLLLSKKGVDLTAENVIGYFDQSAVNDNGSYVFKFKFNGNVDDYELKMYLGDKTVTDSITVAVASYSWVDASVLAVQEDDNLISSELLMNNYYDIEGLTYTIALAFYDEDNKLIYLSLSDDVKTIGNEITKDNLNAIMPDETATVKAIVWSNYTQMIPLCKSSINIAQ